MRALYYIIIIIIERVGRRLSGFITRDDYNIIYRIVRVYIIIYTYMYIERVDSVKDSAVVRIYIIYNIM